jgi:hypothetical protein
MVRDAHSWADLTDDQLQLLRKATLAEISRRQSAAGDEGPVVVGASRVVGEIDHVCCAWGDVMRTHWPAGQPGGTVARALIADGQERLRRLLHLLCVDERGQREGGEL